MEEENRRVFLLTAGISEVCSEFTGPKIIFLCGEESGTEAASCQ